MTSNAVWVASTSGELYELSCASGAPQWSTNVGSPISAPDEQNVSQPLTGLGVGGNTLVVPAGSTVVAYTSSSITGAGSCGTFTGSSSGGPNTGSAGAQSSAATTPGATPQPTPSLRTREAGLLRRELLLHTTVKRLLTRHRITLNIAALAPGRLAFAWALAPAGRRTHHPARITLDVGMKRAGTAHVTLRLTAAVIRTLRQARQGLTATGTAAFTPNSGRSVKVRRSFRLAA